MLLLYKGLVGSILDYASVCYSGMDGWNVIFEAGIIAISGFKDSFGFDAVDA
jgi:hypothetical protein